MAKIDSGEEETNKSWHPNFVEYTEMIVDTPSYDGLYIEHGKNGNVKWVVTGKSANGQKRQKWWDEKCNELGIPIQKGCYAKAARILHPTKKHVCQWCGEEHSIYYEYPSKNTVKILNRILGTTIDANNDEERAECTIREIIEGWCNTSEQIYALAKAFHLPKPKDKNELISLVYSELVEKESARFSPGVMSNPPDRFDGFHSYSLCCRTKFDTGRQQENMATYSQDRRAYEEWADGDWNLANRLMGEFRKQPPMICPVCGNMAKMSADHIGPISLGFCHSIYFAPMCKKCNSSKNNRFTKADVDRLLEYEKRGEQVISWHSKYVWDSLKNKVLDDADAKRLSTVMSRSHQSVLSVFSIIYDRTGQDFLESYLHKEYAMYDIRFRNFDLTDLSKMEVVRTDLDNKNKHKNQERYVRIAFESLDNFKNKENRRTVINLEPYESCIEELILLIKSGEPERADKYLRSIIDSIGDDVINDVWV